MNIIKNINVNNDINQKSEQTNSNNIIITGDNQTGKTTLITYIQFLIGYELLPAHKMLSIPELEGINISINFLIDNKEYLLARDINYKSKFNTYTMSINEYNRNIKFDTFLEFLEYSYKFSFPKILNFRLLRNGDDHNKLTSPYEKISISNIGYLFYLLQDYSLYSTAYSYMDQSSLLLTLIKLTTNRFDEKIENLKELVNKNSFDKALNNLEKYIASGNNLNSKQSVLFSLIMNGNKVSSSKYEKKLMSEITALEYQKEKLSIDIDEIRSELLQFQNDDKLHLSKDFTNYIDKIIYTEYNKSNSIILKDLETKRESYKKERDVIYKEIKELKTEYNKFIDDKFLIKELDEVEITEVFKNYNISNSIKDNYKGVKEKVDLKKELTKIENSYFKEFYDDRFTYLIDELINDLLKFVGNEEFNKYSEDILLFKRLKFSNTRIYNPHDFLKYQDELYVPQGAMIDVFKLLNILVRIELIDKAYKLPPILIDTPFRNENKGFYEVMPMLIIERILNSEKVDFVIVSTASDYLVDKLSRNNQSANINMGNNEDKFIIFNL